MSLADSECLGDPKIMIEEIWLSKGISEKGSPVENWLVGKLAISVAIGASESAER